MCLSANGTYDAVPEPEEKEGSACCYDSFRLCLVKYFL